MYSIDPVTGRWKKSFVNVIGFELEGPELIGVIPLYDAIHESLVTAKTPKEIAKDVAGKWVRYLVSKESTIFKTIVEASSGAMREDLQAIFEATPVPIIASSLNTMFNRRVTFNEAGDKVPSMLLGVLYQFGLKYQATKTLSDGLKTELLTYADRDKAIGILRNYRNAIETIGLKMRATGIPARLMSDSPNRLFENSLKSVLKNHIKINYKGDIHKMATGEISEVELSRRILDRLDGTIISYYPNFSRLVYNIIQEIKRDKWKELKITNEED
jgi:hypothetical protein